MAIFKSRQKSASANLQIKTATADTDDIVILPDTGYDGMSTVTVHPTPSETKTVTATTSSQTVTPTSGKFISEVTVEPQAHTMTYTPATNTAANDMGANHDYRYVNTSGMVVPSGTKSITQNGTEDVTNYASVHVQVSESPLMIHPNNESPAAMVRSNVYQADANGYAIASYSSVTPQSAPTSVSSGNIVKFEDSGIILDEYPFPSMQSKQVTATTSPQTVTPDSGYDGLDAVLVEPQIHTTTFTPQANTVDDMGDVHDYRYVDTSGMVTPSSITPSNSSPAALTSGSAVTPSANGYAISSYSSVTPSNSSPVTLTSGDIVKLGGNGKAVASVTDVTPSHTPTSVATNDVVKIGGSGVIVDSLPTIQSSKSVTATTSQQTVGPDTGYDAITEIVVNPQEHSAFFVPLQNEPYNDMGVHNNYRYVDTSGMVIPHPISPSNSNPVSVAPSYPIEYTANGYAIESYSSITPSNSSPATITSGNIYTATANGKAVSSVTDITPSNSSPVSLSSGSIYKPSASGYAISSYSSKTPSDSSPASVSSGAIIKASSAGYLYKSSGLVNMVNITNTASKDTNFTLSSGSTNSVSVTSKPRLILWFSGNYGSGVSAGYGEMGMYDGINNRYRRVTFYSGGANTATDGGDITSVTSSTVSFKNNGSTYRRYHVMMWY